MPLKHENRRRQITLNVSPYVYDVDAVALSLINQFKADEADPEITKLDDYKLSLTFRENDELSYEVACQKILWNQYVQDIEQKNVINNIELLKKLVDPYFESPVVASINGPVNEVLGDGKGQLDGISPSAFSDGEILWADGKPMPHPSYGIGDSEVRVPAGGPMPLSRDLDKDAQSSTITAFKKFSSSQEMEEHYEVAMGRGFNRDNWSDPPNCKFCNNPEYMAWEYQHAEKNGGEDPGSHEINSIVARQGRGEPRYSCPLCLKRSNDRIRHHLTSDEPYNSNLDK